MSSAPNLSGETRWLRLGGIVLVVGSMTAFAILQDTVSPLQFVRSGDTSNLMSAAVICLVLANAFALGLVLLLAGLRQRSLLTSAQVRRGALTRMAGLNLILLCFVAVELEDSRVFGDEIYSEWYLILIIVAFIFVARGSIMLFRSGWKYDARTAEEALALDPRPPVVYLRSFGIDDQILVTARGVAAKLTGLFTYTASISPEQEMTFILERVGPVIAIGKPGERLPQLGAARLYVGDDEWRTVVGKLINDAALVVIRAGDTANLWWEVQEALTRCPRERVIIVALGQPGTLETFERRFVNTFGAPTARPAASRSAGLMRLLRLVFPYGRGIGRIIYFDSHGKPWAEPLSFQLTWLGAVIGPYRPYRDALQVAFRNIFAELGLRWAPKRSLTGAVLLALFGGIFGLHHFYMGHTRRGVWYLAFSWLALPILLGWIDAARIALLNETQFQTWLKIRPDPENTHLLTRNVMR